jgi:hypothetical protein
VWQMPDVAQVCVTCPWLPAELNRSIDHKPAVTNNPNWIGQGSCSLWITASAICHSSGRRCRRGMAPQNFAGAVASMTWHCPA